MKKNKWIWIPLAAVLLSGCSADNGTDSIDEGMTAMENKEYQAALEDFKTAVALGENEAVEKVIGEWRNGYLPPLNRPFEADVCRMNAVGFGCRCYGWKLGISYILCCTVSLRPGRRTQRAVADG